MYRAHAIVHDGPPAASIFERLESNVRSYSRMWPVVFDRASGSRLYTEDGTSYLDFFAGAGALNYGHNNPRLKRALLDYMSRDGITHSLDMLTVAKRDFLETFDELILRPRELRYKASFPGPGGANSVEAALKLARTVTGREAVISFTNAFHGMTLGALAVTGSSTKRSAAGVPLVHATPVPFDQYFDGTYPDFLYLGRLLDDPGSGLNDPAAIIVETVQGEGGVNSASPGWLRGLSDLCRRHEILLIVDDIQMGCGRTGPFFSFEDAGIVPDIVCLSKSIGGYGLPLAITLIRPELDVWEPGQHTGTFRGVSPAFVAGTEALRAYWTDGALERSTRAKGERIGLALREIVATTPGVALSAKGRGLARGLGFPAGRLATQVCAAAFERGLLIETAGPEDEVAKLLPPLTITDDELTEGLGILAESVTAVVRRARCRA